jgi:hypothetical protein
MTGESLNSCAATGLVQLLLLVRGHVWLPSYSCAVCCYDEVRYDGSSASVQAKHMSCTRVGDIHMRVILRALHVLDARISCTYVGKLHSGGM